MTTVGSQRHSKKTPFCWLFS